MRSVAGSLVKGRTWNSHYFKKWRACVPLGLKEAWASNAVISSTLLWKKENCVHCWKGIHWWFQNKTSNGLISSFRQRHAVLYRTVSWDLQNANSSTVRIMERATVIPNDWGLQTWKHYNVGEIGLFFRLPPNKTVRLNDILVLVEIILRKR